MLLWTRLQGRRPATGANASRWTSVGVLVAWHGCSRHSADNETPGTVSSTLPKPAMSAELFWHDGSLKENITSVLILFRCDTSSTPIKIMIGFTFTGIFPARSSRLT